MATSRTRQYKTGRRTGWPQQTGRQTDRQAAGRQRDRQAEKRCSCVLLRQSYRDRQIGVHGHAGRQAGRQAERQAGRRYRQVGEKHTSDKFVHNRETDKADAMGKQGHAVEFNPPERGAAPI